MSTTLYWEPVTDKGKPLSTDLKFILRMNYDLSYVVVLSDQDKEYLTGIKHASSKDIRREIEVLLNAINKYGEITILEKH